MMRWNSGWSAAQSSTKSSKLENSATHRQERSTCKVEFLTYIGLSTELIFFIRLRRQVSQWSDKMDINIIKYIPASRSTYSRLCGCYSWPSPLDSEWSAEPQRRRHSELRWPSLSFTTSFNRWWTKRDRLRGSQALRQRATRGGEWVIRETINCESAEPSCLRERS